jgi:hypothetical protein
MSSTILVIHGPNLNLLGKREPEVYGYLTLDDINQQLIAQAKDSSLTLETFQSNWEGAIVDRIHQAQTEGVNLSSLTQLHSPTLLSLCEMPYLVLQSLLLKFICPMFTLVKHSDITLFIR